MDGGCQKIKLWEPKAGGVLETTFDSEGAVLAQQIVAPGEAGIAQRMLSALGAEALAKASEKPYEDVRLARPCPSCGSPGLMRYSDAFSKEAPVMPTYYCSACKKRGYYLTDEYLEFLVDNNIALFNDAELRELTQDRSAFVSELKEYIIRIFAAKHVARIR